jgi:phosphoglycolate phosphatase-like HAD superfamily hydrolase
MGLRAYLFDIDGTLVLTGGAGTRALNRVFRDRYAIEGAMDAVQPGGKTDPMIVREVFHSRLGRDAADDEIAAIFEVYVPLLRVEIQASARFRTMPAAVETVRWLGGQSGVKLGLATGNIRGAAEAKLAHIDLWGAFGFGGYGDDSGDRAELVRIAMQRAGAADEYVVVGDTPRDIEAARACGCRVVCVPTGSTSADELAGHRPDALFATLAELPSWHQVTR